MVKFGQEAVYNGLKSKYGIYHCNHTEILNLHASVRKLFIEKSKLTTLCSIMCKLKKIGKYLLTHKQNN